ncbi:MAG: hypothetical protein Q4C42_04445 [Clostridia bacterium]|nr:hypothetical protein [Clostridia bacterium]
MTIYDECYIKEIESYIKLIRARALYEIQRDNPECKRVLDPYCFEDYCGNFQSTGITHPEFRLPYNKPLELIIAEIVFYTLSKI